MDRSHRKLAHRGSRLELVHVSESTVRRVLAVEGYVLPGKPRPGADTADALAGLAGVETQPGCGPTTSPISPGLRRAALAIIDVVSRQLDPHPGLC